VLSKITHAETFKRFTAENEFHNTKATLTLKAYDDNAGGFLSTEISLSVDYKQRGGR